MGRLLIVQPLPMAAITASRGDGASNLASPSPREVWADAATGTATLTVDLGQARSIDTVLLGYLYPAAADATWTISGGIGGPDEAILLPQSTLRAPDITGGTAVRSHALWTGIARTVRFLKLSVTQPAGAQPLTAGVIVAGKAFNADLGQEWGGGRQPFDLGVATELPDGGFAVREGATKREFKWTFGDLSYSETDQLEAIALDLGDTRPGVVIEDTTLSAGLVARIHYGLFKWSAFERRNRAQTRWEISMREWV